MKLDVSKYTCDTVMHCDSLQEAENFFKYVHDNGIDRGELADRANISRFSSIDLYIHELATQVLKRYDDGICIRFTYITGHPGLHAFGWGSVNNYQRSGYLILEYSDFEWDDSAAEIINPDNSEIQNFLTLFTS